MTMTLAHPAAEDLGRFVEGTLDDAGRAAVVAHIADCDECRIVVVDAAEFVEPATESHWHWWVASAAAVMLVVGAAFFFNATRDPLAKTREDYAQLSKRPIQARLGVFPYVPWRVTRSGNDEGDISLDIMKGDAVNAAELRAHNAKTFDERGIGLLLTEKPDDAVASFEEATKRDPTSARYQSDLAAALIVSAGKQQVEAAKQQRLLRAVAACDQALKIDDRAQDALFNRAIALQTLDRTDEAIRAYKRYLATDPSSQWADEARASLNLLSQTP